MSSVPAPENLTILYLDTASPRLMVGLSRDGEWLGRYEQDCDSHRYHSALMTPAIQDLLDAAGLAPNDLTALAVNIGPGSFTGIRTGIITARTMGQFLNVPVYAFNTFELQAFEAQSALQIDEMWTVYLDASRGRVYRAALSYGSNGPVYHQAPGMAVLSSENSTLPEQGRLLAAASLESVLLVESWQRLPEALYTPMLMGALIRRYGSYFQREWRDVAPLYLQEPSITLKPNRSITAG
jgi:tRNA threonylcarbamoyl adenosine modification protein YeaZ